ncbi:MAG: helix-turn-helix domain containing protein [Desulfovibrio sp.]|uniref:helix-turn-helix domain-containing protein n=1 Tax=Desulfovibrio sp. TaxID=885 RepID=UPI0025876900|nr:helix-turn-helix domain-containing protein [Desulfovibrio sp.]MCD7982758.1 helix-turn-helix domain containing protein [Desulfovibrio sp.]
MNQSYEASFDEQMDRIRLITGKRTQIELANFFGIRQSLVSDAKRRGKIPSDWLMILLQTKNVNPEWLPFRQRSLLYAAAAP